MEEDDEEEPSEDGSRCVEVRSEHHRYLMTEDIAEHSSADSTEDTACHDSYGPEPQCFSLHAADCGENPESYGIEVLYDRPASDCLGTYEEHKDSHRDADQYVCIVAEDGYREDAENRIAEHAAAAAYGYGEDDDTEEIKPVADTFDSTRNREDRSTEDIECVDNTTVHNGSSLHKRCISVHLPIAGLPQFSYIQGMGKIRSAWEIALEKTEGIHADKEKMQHKNDVEAVRRIAGSFLSADTVDTDGLRKDLGTHAPDAVREGLMMTIESNLSLPQSENEGDERLERLKTLLSIATSDNPQAMGLMEELTQFLKQYPLHRKDLLEKMKAQYKPVLEEKAARLSKQYGTEIHLNFENDKEFIEAARQNLERLEAQYQATLTNAKKQMAQIAGTV